MKRSEQAALKAYPDNYTKTYFGIPYIPVYLSERKAGYREGYEQAEKDILSMIESRLSELLGDAQPTPILRYELLDLVKKIKEVRP